MAVQSGYLTRLSLGQLGVPPSRESERAEPATAYRELRRRPASLQLLESC